jgi:regulator of ribosome biosynthesis
MALFVLFLSAISFYSDSPCRVFDLPVESSELGPLATLPREEMRFPREKRIPEPKPETKWAKFAKEKGITKKKKERMVFDEEQQEFRPRYGYKGANKTIEEHAVVEVKAGQDRFADPWAAAREAKKGRVAKNKDQQIRNLERASGIKRGKQRSKSVDAYGERLKICIFCICASTCIYLC